MIDVATADNVILGWLVSHQIKAIIALYLLKAQHKAGSDSVERLHSD